jgi:GNAT superfamily N-acetyltransferase
MNVRNAVTGDFGWMAAWGQEFVRSAYGGDYSRPAVIEMLRMLMENHVLLVAEREGGIPLAMAGAMLFPRWWNPAMVEAIELFWWVTPDARRCGVGRIMLESLELRCKERGAAKMTMVRTANLDLTQMYLRRGYAPLEEHFSKEL